MKHMTETVSSVLGSLKSGRIRCAIRAIFDFHVLQARAVL